MGTQLLSVLLIGAATFLPLPDGSALTSPPRQFIFAANALSEVEAASPSLARALGADQVFEVVDPGESPLAGLDATLADHVYDSAQVTSEVKGGLPNGARWSLLDQESWHLSDRYARQHPAADAKKAASVLKAARDGMISAPAIDLESDLPCHESLYLCFESQDIIGSEAAVSQAVDIQGQSLELDPAEFRGFLKTEVAQARAANPGVTIFAGISTSLASGHPTAAELERDVSAAESAGADGLWINIPGDGAAANVSLAVKVLLAEGV
jgi:hypothetical protein